jgi:hypothetical protein
MRARAGVARKVGSLHFVMMMIGLLALAVQSFVVQTHIHIPQGAGRAQTVSLVTLAATAVSDASGIKADAPFVPRDKYPITEDPSNCPLCQEVAHFGQFLHSAAVLLTLPFAVTVNFIIFDEALPSFFAVSHIWQGRAPPLRSTTV